MAPNKMKTSWTVRPGTNGALREPEMRNAEELLRKTLTSEVRDAWDSAHPDVKANVLYRLVDSPEDGQRSLQWFLVHLDALPADMCQHELDLFVEDCRAQGLDQRLCPHCLTPVEGYICEGLERLYVGGFVYQFGGGGKGIIGPRACVACGKELVESPYRINGVWFVSAEEFADYEKSLERDAETEDGA